MPDETELPMNANGGANPDAHDHGRGDLLIPRAARELRAPVAFGADFDARVMAAVRAAAADDAVERRVAEHEAQEVDVVSIASARDARGRRGAWTWVTRPRTLRISPLAGLAAAA